jgi:hypothetical protein
LSGLFDSHLLCSQTLTEEEEEGRRMRWTVEEAEMLFAFTARVLTNPNIFTCIFLVEFVLLHTNNHMKKREAE